eukprot:g13332.t1
MGEMASPAAPSRESGEARVRIEPSAVVCVEAIFRGDFPIFIAEDCVVHPNARITAGAGPVFLGRGNVVEEQAEIANEAFPEGVRVGCNNLFEARSCVKNVRKIGDWNLFEVNSSVKNLKSVGSDCVVGVNVKLHGVLEERAPADVDVDSRVLGGGGGDEGREGGGMMNMEVENGLVFPVNPTGEPIAAMTQTSGAREARNHEKLLEVLKESLPKYHVLKT